MAASASAAAEEEDWGLPSEVEVLQSIYLDELQVVKGSSRSSPWEISITLHPATAEDHDSQYVCCTLLLQVPAQYPHEVPLISIRNPRGLSDEQIHKISQTLSHVATDGLGTAMLYELIEKGKEILTDNNIPHGQCVICLYGFQEKEAFTKTSCYHYFHCHCLARYIQHMEQELQSQEQELQHSAASALKQVAVQCPVCREPLVYDLALLKAAPEPQQPMEQYQPSAENLRQQEERKRLYQRQQERGGIIDLEAERNRYFIRLQQPPASLEQDPASARGSAPPSALTTEPSAMPLAQPTLPPPLPMTAQNPSEKIPGLGPPQPRLGVSLKAVPETPQASRGSWRQPEPRHLKGGTCHVPKGTSGPHELPAPQGTPKDLKLEPQSQRVEGPPRERGPGTWQGPPPRRTRDSARWERSKGRMPAASYPRLPRGRGTYQPGSRRDPLSLESEDGS
ncbi:E3 ubiquitin-protein ligase RNF25 [Suncus etruscus]|uniref:E3 ubiquitin-protein ligase RNF25 n=1 Tax=Suncus etruscus TaxID=109475 RepID=UPI00210F580F|nr:E3 ubiquitin-protein ligase RNF25 [Suncus etruscus]